MTRLDIEPGRERFTDPGLGLADAAAEGLTALNALDVDEQELPQAENGRESLVHAP